MTEGRSTAAFSTRSKWPRWAAVEEPRESTRGMIMSPFAPFAFAWAASAAACSVFCAPVPTMTGRPAFAKRSTPSMRCSIVRSGQSPIEPQ